MNPPLRKRRSLQYLWNGLNDGTIDIVASDHAPHTEAEKQTDIWSAPAGVPGVETMLPLMLLAVRRNLIPLPGAGYEEKPQEEPAAMCSIDEK